MAKRKETDAPGAGPEESMPPSPQLDPGELERRLDDLEDRLRRAYDRDLAGAYRSCAAAHGEHGRAVAFLEERVEESGEAPWRLELSLAYVDKIPTCEGLAAMLCKGNLARKSLDQLDQIVGEQPESWLALYLRGVNHLHWPRALGHAGDAVRDFERCVEIQERRGEVEPHHLRAWVALGQAYVKAGRREDARRAWRRGLEEFPGAGELEDLLAIEDDAELLDRVREQRSLEQPIDTDVSFCEGL